MFVNKNRNEKNKKAISELVSYVLLITLAIAMAAAAWFFLKPYAEKPLPEEECPESVSIVLENYSCNGTHINYTLSNRGFFNITGIKLAIVNGTDDIEYSFWLYIPKGCDDLENCTECNGDSAAACLPVNGKMQPRVTSYEAFAQINKLVIYPLRTGEKGFYQVCTNAIVKIPIENCGRARTGAPNN